MDGDCAESRVYSKPSMKGEKVTELKSRYPPSTMAENLSGAEMADAYSGIGSRISALRAAQPAPASRGKLPPLLGCEIFAFARPGASGAPVKAVLCASLAFPGARC